MKPPGNEAAASASEVWDALKRAYVHDLTQWATPSRNPKVCVTQGALKGFDAP